jgi:PAS domain-containing protein
MSLRDAARRWRPVIERLKARVARTGISVPAHVEHAFAETLTTCERLLQDLITLEGEYADLERKLKDQGDEWQFLFEQLPIPCVVTDLGGWIVQANRAAGELLHFTPRHLENRELKYFAQDREAFLGALRQLAAETSIRASFVIRPRERAPLTIDVIAIPRTPSDSMLWLWFLVPRTDT